MSYPHDAGDFTISSPGGAIGNFVVDPAPNYYELSFDLDSAWTNITYTVVSPDGQALSNQAAWKSTSIDKV